MAEDGNDKEQPQEAHGTVEFLMRRMRHKGDLPAFSDHIVEINNKLSSLTTITYSSGGDLAKIILKDISLTNKLLRVVNSALYSNLAGKVTTISKAVLLLGFDKVRMIAAALLVFDHLQDKSQVKALKEAAIGSFMSGLIAMGVAENMKLDGREEVFICGMLHNLGKMLVICYFPEEYEEIRNRMVQTGLDEGKASKAVLGITYNGLGMAVSRSWNFPDKIVRSMDVLPPGVIPQPMTEHEILRNLSNYSNELFNSVMSAQETDRAEVLADISKRYHNSIPLQTEQIENLIESAVTNIDHYSDIVRLDKKTSAFVKELLQSRQSQISESNKAPAATQTTQGQIIPAESDTVASKSSDAGKEQQTNILNNGIREINEVMKGSFSLSDIIYMVLEMMYRGLKFNRVIFCMKDVKSAKMAARFGLGENADELVKLFQFPIGQSSDIFNIAISQAKGIIIDDAAAPNILKNLPKWYRDIIMAPSFLIYPLNLKGTCIGMFYADLKEKGTMLTDVQRNYMEDLRSTAINAIMQKHR
jgi:eukaryotic-like serine/threonine-protein kinase